MNGLTRLRLLIDVTVSDTNIARLADVLTDQPIVDVRIDGAPEMVGRCVGAREAHDPVAEVATASDLNDV